MCVCRYVTMMPRLRQALIEFENMEDAINCVQSCQVCTNILPVFPFHSPSFLLYSPPDLPSLSLFFSLAVFSPLFDFDFYHERILIIPQMCSPLARHASKLCCGQ